MHSSPRAEFADKDKASALKRRKMVEEALLKSRDSGEGPVFTESQILNLSSWCKQHGADPLDFVAAYTAYVISEFSVNASGPELVAQVEKAEPNPPRPHVVIDLHKKNILRRPSGETPEEKLERRYHALQAEKKRAAGAKT